MKAIRVHEFGGPEVLKFEEVPTPNPAARQVLVRIHAVGVNPYDTYMRNGVYPIKPPLPYTPGSDAAGVVEAVGPDVKKVKPGDRVYTAGTVSGAYAQYAIALEDQVHRLPDKVTFAQGAGVWVPYGTAYHALYQTAKVRAGETVLIHRASEAWASPPRRWPAPSDSPSLAPPARKKVWKSPNERAPTKSLITPNPAIKMKF